MPLTTDTKADFALKILLNKALTDATNKGPGNEAIGNFVQVPASVVFFESIPTEPVAAQALGIAEFVSGAHLVRDPSANNFGFFAVYPSGHYLHTPATGDVNDLNAFGTRVENNIPPAFGNGYEAVPIDVNGDPIPVADARDWIFEYQNGVWFQEDDTPSTVPSGINLYRYTGKFVTDMGIQDLSGVNFDALTSGDMIVYNGEAFVTISSGFIGGGGGGGSTTLAGLTDTQVGTAASGQALGYDGTNWVNTDAGLTEAEADLNYLKLDSSNDPLTGTLTIDGPAPTFIELQGFTQHEINFNDQNGLLKARLKNQNTAGVGPFYISSSGTGLGIALRPLGPSDTANEFRVSDTAFTYQSQDIWHSGNHNGTGNPHPQYVQTSDANSTYLRLDASNDPVTGELSLDTHLFTSGDITMANNTVIRSSNATDSDALRMLFTGADNVLNIGKSAGFNIIQFGPTSTSIPVYLNSVGRSLLTAAASGVFISGNLLVREEGSAHEGQELFHVSGRRSKLNNLLIGEVAGNENLMQSLLHGYRVATNTGNITLEAASNYIAMSGFVDVEEYVNAAGYINSDTQLRYQGQDTDERYQYSGIAVPFAVVDLTDTSFVGLTSGQILGYDGANWVNTTDAGGLTEGTADGLYLRLDTSNDPLTNRLDITEDDGTGQLVLQYDAANTSTFTTDISGNLTIDISGNVDNDFNTVNVPTRVRIGEGHNTTDFVPELHVAQDPASGGVNPVSSGRCIALFEGGGLVSTVELMARNSLSSEIELLFSKADGNEMAAIQVSRAGTTDSLDFTLGGGGGSIGFTRGSTGFVITNLGDNIDIPKVGIADKNTVGAPGSSETRIFAFPEGSGARLGYAEGIGAGNHGPIHEILTNLHDISGLFNVVTDGVISGEMLAYDGTNWVNSAEPLTQVDADALYAPLTRNLTAGAGLTGGGTLAADRTFDVGGGDGITVNANDIEVDTTFVHLSGVAVPFAIEDLTDTQIVNLISGHTLGYDGTNWVNTADSLTEVEADSLYLKLDSSNDPLTDSLVISGADAARGLTIQSRTSAFLHLAADYHNRPEYDVEHPYILFSQDGLTGVEARVGMSESGGEKNALRIEMLHPTEDILVHTSGRGDIPNLRVEMTNIEISGGLVLSGNLQCDGKLTYEGQDTDVRYAFSGTGGSTPGLQDVINVDPNTGFRPHFDSGIFLGTSGSTGAAPGRINTEASWSTQTNTPAFLIQPTLSGAAPTSNNDSPVLRIADGNGDHVASFFPNGQALFGSLQAGGGDRDNACIKVGSLTGSETPEKGYGIKFQPIFSTEEANLAYLDFDFDPDDGSNGTPTWWGGGAVAASFWFHSNSSTFEGNQGIAGNFHCTTDTNLISGCAAMRGVVTVTNGDDTLGDAWGILFDGFNIGTNQNGRKPVFNRMTSLFIRKGDYTGNGGMAKFAAGGCNQMYGLRVERLDDTVDPNDERQMDAEVFLEDDAGIFFRKTWNQQSSEARGQDPISIYSSGVDTLDINSPGELRFLNSGTMEIHISGGHVLLPNLPTSDPGVTGALWNDAGTLKVS